GTRAGDLISEIGLAVEMGCTPTDIGKTIHPHPTLSESIGMAAEVYEGHCTDLPPQKKKKKNKEGGMKHDARLVVKQPTRPGDQRPATTAAANDLRRRQIITG